MRIRSLDLIAFGPFRDKTLRFSNDGGVEVVFGPNEAGKSTTRRAILGLLFGIPHHSKDGHSVDEVRVGATLVLAGGKTLEVIRRKGRKNTLHDSHDHPIDPQVMAGLVGGLDAETFELTYGLDHIRLRQGGAALKLGNGEMGESLFSAATGLTGLHAVLLDLRREAEALFVPQGTKRPLNEAQRSYTDAKKRTAALATPPDKWLEVEKQLEGVRSTLQALRAERAVLAAERAAAQAIAAAHTALETHRARLAELEPALVQTRAEMETLSPSAALLAATQQIADLQERLGSHRKAQLDRPRIAAELDAIEERAMKTRRDAPKGTEGAGVVETHVRKLVIEGASLRERVKQLEAQEAELASAAARAEERLATIAPEVTDTVALREALDMVQQEGNIETRLEAARDRARRDRAAAEMRLGALGTACRTLHELLALVVPSSDVVAVHARTFAGLAERRRHAFERRQRLEEERTDAERSLVALRGEGDVPTEEALAVARQDRDAQWEVLCEAKTAPKGKDATRFERSLRGADELADRLRREAARVTRKTESEASVAAASRKLEVAFAEEGAIASDTANAERAWATLWESARVAVRSPDEMATWLGRHGVACAAAESVLEAERAVEILEASVARSHDALRMALVGHGETTRRDESLAQLTQTAKRRLAAHDDGLAARAVEERALEAARRNLDQVARDRKRCERERAEWDSHWAVVTGALGLRESASPEEAQAAMDALAALARIDEEADKTRRRLAGIDRDAERFSDDVRALCEACAVDGLSRPTEEVCIELSRRVARATDQHTRRAMLEEQERRLEVQVRAVSASVEHDAKTAAALGEPSLSIAELDIRVAELDDRIQQTSRNLGGLETGAKQFDQSPAIEQAAEAQRQLARVRDLAERYVRARLGASAVARVLERYRRDNQGPVLARASALFTALTLGTYAGLEVGFDEADEPALVAVRGDGRRLETSSLSDGTLDQLYLALRVASLERLAEARGPLPLLLDDVLVHFDDQRAAAALAILGGLAKHTQVILFTHHARIVEIARRAMSDLDGASAAGIHDLAAL